MSPSIAKYDWEEFRALGRIPPSIREVILQSWQRSGTSEICGLKGAPKLGVEELFSAHRRVRRLRNVAKPAMQKADYLLHGSGNMLLLSDDKGVIIDAVGDAATLDLGRENHLHLGGCWDEKAIGTNAIGTALHLKRPVQISGVEHFCEEIQKWNCAATPIIDPGSGRLLGVIDLSWADKLPKQNAIALSAALAMQVEAALQQKMAQERESLAKWAQSLGRRGKDNSLLLLDRNGLDILASESLTDLGDDYVALSELRAELPDLIEMPKDDLASILHARLPGFDVELVPERDETIGVLIRLDRPKSRNSKMQLDADLARMGRAGSQIAVVCSVRRLSAWRELPYLY